MFLIVITKVRFYRYQIYQIKSIFYVRITYLEVFEKRRTAAQEKPYGEQNEESFADKLEIPEKKFKFERQNITNEAIEERKKSDFNGIQSYFKEQLRNNTETDEDNPEHHHISKFLQPFNDANKNEP